MFTVEPKKLPGMKKSTEVKLNKKLIVVIVTTKSESIYLLHSSKVIKGPLLKEQPEEHANFEGEFPSLVKDSKVQISLNKMYLQDRYQSGEERHKIGLSNGLSCTAFLKEKEADKLFTIPESLDEQLTALEKHINTIVGKAESNLDKEIDKKIKGLEKDLKTAFGKAKETLEKVQEQQKINQKAIENLKSKK